MEAIVNQMHNHYRSNLITRKPGMLPLLDNAVANLDNNDSGPNGALTWLGVIFDAAKDGADDLDSFKVWCGRVGIEAPAWL